MPSENINIQILGTDSKLKEVNDFIQSEFPEVLEQDTIDVDSTENLRPRRRAINIFIFPKHKYKIFILRIRQTFGNQVFMSYWNNYEA